MKSSETHYLEKDPGISWAKIPGVMIDVEPNSGQRVLTPNVLRINEGMYRMYFCEGVPRGKKNKIEQFLGQFSNKYAVIGEIVSATSVDGKTWRREKGGRVPCRYSEGEIWTVSPDVIKLSDSTYRMYFQSRSANELDVIRSARSVDGLNWERDEGIRFSGEGASYGSPKCIYIGGGKYRLYFHESPHPFRPGRGSKNNIVSALSTDGLKFFREPGFRIEQESRLETYSVYAPEVLRLTSGEYRMYFAGWSNDPIRGRIFSAKSTDGLTWEKSGSMCVDIGGQLQEIKVSEPSVSLLENGSYYMYYEASDADGQWRIFAAASQNTAFSHG